MKQCHLWEGLLKASLVVAPVWLSTGVANGAFGVANSICGVANASAASRTHWCPRFRVHNGCDTPYPMRPMSREAVVHHVRRLYEANTRIATLTVATTALPNSNTTASGPEAD